MQDITTYNGQSPFDQIKLKRMDGSEFWSARELMPLMGYSAWRNFLVPLNRARTSAANQGANVEIQFARSHNVADRPQGGGNHPEDFELSRFACYLVAMNGDPNKPEVAAAQAYFAIRTREAEVAPKQLTGPELVAAALIEAQSMLEAKDKQIAELAPRAEYVDTFVADDDLRLFRNVAKSLGVTEMTLRLALIEHKWIYVERSSRWSNSQGKKIMHYRYSPYAHTARYFAPVPNHEAPLFKGEVDHTLKITPAGAVAIARVLAKWGITVDKEIAA